MNPRTSPLRSLISVAASASILATSFAAIATPIITTAATTCVVEEGSTTVYPALVHAQPTFQGAVVIPQPAWATAQKLGCDASLLASGSGSGKAKLMDWLTNQAGSHLVDIAASSAPLSGSANSSAVSATEIETALLTAFQIGGDAMVMAVRNDNPLTQITMGEVTAIYNGQVTNWSQLSNAGSLTGAIVPRARIAGSGTRDDMNRLFKMDRGTVDAAGHKVSCSAGFTSCEPNVIDATGLARLTTSQEEADAVCNSVNAIVYTSLANLQLYGPGTAGCDPAGHTLKALLLQSCSYSGFSGATTFPLTCSGSFVTPNTTTAAAGGAYPAQRALYLALPKVSAAIAKYGVGNGTGWTDQLGMTKAADTVNYMLSTVGQTSVSASGFITVGAPAKQPIPDADIDLNGGIGLTDIGQITGRWNRTDTIAGSIRADVDNNGGVGLTDIGKITGQWGAAGFVAP
jgi:ABC-type phosphate transport system substrate-binding protein